MTTRYIICCGMRRAGSTLQYHLAKDIVETAHQDWTVLKTHFLTPEYREYLAGGGATCLYIYRDIRDVVVSELHLNRQAFTFQNVCGSDIIGDALRSYEEWMAVGGLYVARYETIIDDLESEVRRLAAHLHCELRDEDVERIARQNSIESTRGKLPPTTGEELLALDRNTLLFNRHIHSGKPGQYRDVMTTLQIKWIETLAYDWLVARGYPVSLSRASQVILRPLVCLAYSWLRWKASRRKPQARE